MPTASGLEAALDARVREAAPGGVRFVARDGGPPALDYGGASKGLALDRAASVLDADASVLGALVTAGSTTIAIGSKPGGDTWRIGVEDPREPGSIVAVFERASGPLVVSTSGDYQKYFETEGVRYHHILDPSTGAPARGLRSLTIASTSHSALQADILSTALFVDGLTGALEEATARGLSVYLVDDEGSVHTEDGPAGSGISLDRLAEPVSRSEAYSPMYCLTRS